MARLVKKIDTVGRKGGLEIGIMNNGNLRIGVTRYINGCPVIQNAFIEKSSMFGLIEAIKEVVKEGNGGQLPLFF